MDEVDGMSAGDRGGVGALNAVIRKTKVPIIAIANDAKSQKMKPLLSTCFQMTFKRCARSLCSPRARLPAACRDDPGRVWLTHESNSPTAQEIRSRVMSIAFKCVSALFPPPRLTRN